MRFHSTRGIAPEVDIKAVTLAGLAPDGGLYLPKTWPHFPASEIEAMRSLSYQECALRVLSPFMEGVIPEEDLRILIDKSYAVFDKIEITPLQKLDQNISILELFHGPTLAFKDIALQFLGHVFEYFLQDTRKRLTIVGATSGDTGSAAIAALANRKNIDVFILYPYKGLSDIQRKQMTCQEAPNIHVIAIEGSFDDCQRILKSLFANKALRDELNLSTVNSINLLRILAQTVYYFVASNQSRTIPSFIVPTGNFGDIYAAYAASKCGLPIEKLVVATNSNDILDRFFKTGRMAPEEVRCTLSPSMDIQISSNFERLLYDLCDSDPKLVSELMDTLKNEGNFSVSSAQLLKANALFVSGKAEDTATLKTISDIYKKYGTILDPHTAVGVKVALDFQKNLLPNAICLATAHPAKFPETVLKAIGQNVALPPKTAALIKKPERTTLLAADIEKVSIFIKERKKS